MRIFFILIFLLSFHLTIDNKNANAHTKISENFEGAEFPPQGWSVINSQPGESEWKISDRIAREGNKCVVSNFTSTGSENILVSKSFTVTEGDSLIFYFRQSFWNNYQDTFEVFVSTIDSLSIKSGTRLISLKDSISYPIPFNYERISISLDEFAGQNCWIGFRHVNLDGDNIRLDDVSVEQPSYSELGVTENTYPSGNLSTCAYEFFIPKATIKNFGNTDLKTPFSITYTISGILEYTSTVLDTLSSGNSRTIIFDTLFADLPGTYNIKIYTSLPDDQNPSNDTLYSTLNLINSNYGGGSPLSGNYFFSNSNSCAIESPSHPEFCWKDTSGSISLILNGVDVSGGLLTGDVDDGYFSLGNILPENKVIGFFNSHYDSVFISTNGLIGFKNNSALLLSDPANISNLMSNPVPVFSPLWMDMDFGNTYSTENRLSYKVAGNQLIITYEKLPLKSGGTEEYISYQVCIETGNPSNRNSILLVQYNKEQTGETFIDKYNNGILPLHLIGMKNTFSNNYLIYRAKDTTGITTPGPFLNTSLALSIGPSDAALENKCSSLELHVLLEAGHNAGDTILISLRDCIAPYKELESRKVFINSLGIINTTLSIPAENYSYYIAVDHRNSIYTWSRENGESFTDFDLDYDFTAGDSMAYGGNMITIEGRSYIYTGDVNKDEIVDSDDMIFVYNGINEFHSGYIQDDLNLDGVADLDDLVYVYNNVRKFAAVQAP